VASFVDSFAGRLDELPTLPWTLSDTTIELTHDEVRALAAEVNALVDRYRREPGRDGRPGAARAVVQFQLLPDEDRTRDRPW
jgi:hypothetical protein